MIVCVDVRANEPNVQLECNHDVLSFACLYHAPSQREFYDFNTALIKFIHPLSPFLIQRYAHPSFLPKRHQYSQLCCIDQNSFAWMDDAHRPDCQYRFHHSCVMLYTVKYLRRGLHWVTLCRYTPKSLLRMKLKLGRGFKPSSKRMFKDNTAFFPQPSLFCLLE